MIQLVIRELKLVRPVLYILMPMFLWGMFAYSGLEREKMVSTLFILIVSVFWMIISSSMIHDFKGSRILIQSLPVTRKQIVLSRFFVSIPFIMIAYLLNALVVLIQRFGLYERSNYTIPTILELLIIISVHYLFASIYHVANYRFNNRGVNFFFMFFIMLFVNMMFVLFGGFTGEINNLFTNPITVLETLLVSIFIASTCYFLSLQIYKKHRS